MRISDWSSDVCSAEFAILVSRYVAGMGLGRHLMRRLVRWARGKKLERMYGDVLESNQPILSLADPMGFRREASDTPGLVRVVLDLVTADVPRAGTWAGERRAEERRARKKK